MRVRSGVFLTLALSLVLGGCAAGAAGGGGAAAAGPGGVRPRETDATRRAQVLILQNQHEQALALLTPTLAAADSANPRAQLLAGEAYAGLGRFDDANRAFAAAQRLYPAYEPDIISTRETAWSKAFNEGVTAYNAGSVDAAVTAWERANTIYGGRPEAFQNLAAIYTQRGDYDKAIAAYRSGLTALGQGTEGRTLTPEETARRNEVTGEMQENLAEILLFTERYADAERLYRERLTRDSTNIALQSQLAAAIQAQPGREAEAQAMYTRLLAMPNLTANDYHEIGVATFNAKNYQRSLEAFSKVSAARPNSRDAFYNHSNTLYALEQWAPLLPVAEKLVQLDPLTEDSWLILARAQREARQNTQALASLQVIENMPIKIKRLTTNSGAARTTLRGEIEGNAAAAGTPVQLRFTFYGANNEVVGTQTASVNAPAREASGTFTVNFDHTVPITGYKYEVVR